LSGHNHFQTPAQLPDLMPIELVRNDHKYFICTEWKPSILAELITGIANFWINQVTID
jgi:hypothetical protein